MLVEPSGAGRDHTDGPKPTMTCETSTTSGASNVVLQPSPSPQRTVHGWKEAPRAPDAQAPDGDVARFKALDHEAERAAQRETSGDDDVRRGIERDAGAAAGPATAWR
jgi:hypothetical protein